MFLKKLISIVIDVVNLIKGKAKVSDVIMELVARLPQAILDAIQFGHIDSAAKLEDALLAFDAYTGSDSGAVDILRDLPPDKEEELFDALKTMVSILGNNKLKTPGYFVEV